MLSLSKHGVGFFNGLLGETERQLEFVRHGVAARSHGPFVPGPDATRSKVEW
jgi:hypothetical protein